MNTVSKNGIIDKRSIGIRQNKIKERSRRCCKTLKTCPELALNIVLAVLSDPTVQDCVYDRESQLTFVLSRE